MINNETAKKIVKILDDKKAEDIKLIRISELTVLADYFIIANGTSNTHVRALAEEVEELLAEDGILPRSIEGRSTGWILLDYGDIVVHVFTPADRDYYSRERLWKDAAFEDISDIIQ